jgi:hypothetical protein
MHSNNQIQVWLMVIKQYLEEYFRHLDLQLMVSKLLSSY